MEITFAIIGTAGRGDDAKKLNKHYYDAMCVVAEELLSQFAANNYPVTHVVSGGAAWADHVAVTLFLNKKVKNLRLYLPCEWDNGSFQDNGVDDNYKNPGRTLNKYHNAFNRRIHIHSLSQIQIAKGNGAELLPCRGGFFGRNAMVAKSDLLLAMTFGDKQKVKDGGTANTVKAYLERVRKGELYDKSFHFDLNDGEVYPGCELMPESPEMKLKKAILGGKHGHILVP